MSCCFNSNVVDNQDPSCCLKVSRGAAIGLAAAAAVIAVIAIVSIFVPPVGLFLLGASFTASLATMICVGSGIGALLFGLAATILCCKSSAGTVVSTVPAETSARLIGFVDTYNVHFDRFKNAITNKNEQPGLIRSHAELAQDFPARVEFLQSNISYQFAVGGVRVTILYSGEDQFKVICDNSDYNHIVARRMKELHPDWKVS